GRMIVRLAAAAETSFVAPGGRLTAGRVKTTDSPAVRSRREVAFQERIWSQCGRTSTTPRQLMIRDCRGSGAAWLLQSALADRLRQTAGPLTPCRPWRDRR